MNAAVAYVEQKSGHNDPCVRIQPSKQIRLPAKESVELLGDLHGGGGTVKVLPRTDIKGLKVSEGYVIKGKVHVKVANTSENTIVINHAHVLAELSSDHPVSALVGPMALSTVIIDGKKTTCLIDSGSQITSVSESY